MDVNRLLGDELTYELAVRGAATDNKTVAGKRSILRGILRCEKEGWPSSSPAKLPNLNPTSEMLLCEAKLNELEPEIKRFESTIPVNDFKRINSRFLHVVSRLNRINCTDADDDAKKQSLHARCMQLIGNLCELNSAPPQEASLLDQPNEPLMRNPLDEANNLLPEINQQQQRNDQQQVLRLDALHSTERAPLDDPPTRFRETQHSPVSHFTSAIQKLRFDEDYPPSSSRFVPVHKWNLVFDGNGSVTNFLDRVNELCESRRVSRSQLFQSAAELFTGDALIWFRSVRPMLHTWFELEDALKTNFLPHDYETKLWYEIHRRSQGAEEKVVVYIAVMEILFNRLPSKPPESERIRLIKHNLLPYFHPLLAVKSINTLVELIHIYRDLEEAHHCAEQFKPPPAVSKFLLEPDLAYKRPFSRVSTLDVSAHEFQLTDASSSTTDMDTFHPQPPSIAIVTCWNCRKTGHRYSACTEPRRMYCFRCGSPGFTTKTCLKCSGNTTGSRQ